MWDIRGRKNLNCSAGFIFMLLKTQLHIIFSSCYNEEAHRKLVKINAEIIQLFHCLSIWPTLLENPTLLWKTYLRSLSCLAFKVTFSFWVLLKLVYNTKIFPILLFMTTILDANLIIEQSSSNEGFMYLSAREQTFLVVWQGIKSLGQIYQGFWEKNLSPVKFSKIRPLLMLSYAFCTLIHKFDEFYKTLYCTKLYCSTEF